MKKILAFLIVVGLICAIGLYSINISKAKEIIKNDSGDPIPPTTIKTIKPQAKLVDKNLELLIATIIKIDTKPVDKVTKNDKGFSSKI